MRRPLLLPLLGVLLAAGCGSSTRSIPSGARGSGDDAQVRGTVRDFVGAIGRDDLVGACARLDPQFGGRLGCGAPGGPVALDLHRAQPSAAGLSDALSGLAHLQIRHVDVRNISPKVIGADVNVAWGPDPRRLTTTYHLTKPGPTWTIDDIALGPPAGQD